MVLEKNSWLEKYELKKPDYDLTDRAPAGLDDILYESARFFHNGELWQSRKKHEGRRKVRVMFVGDITCFTRQFNEAFRGDGYDFSYEFEQIKPIFALADLVVGNLETTIFPNAPYRSEKLVSEQNFHCNAPVEFLDAIRKAGIDCVTTANNHDLDTGAIGIGATIDYIERFGLIQTGTFKTEKKRYELIDVDGFKIALIAFATEHNNKRCNLTPEGADFLLNDYSKESAKSIISDARNAGAELVFTCIHWGKENATDYGNAQRIMAEELAEAGCDCIIGSHPHVLQPYETINIENKTVPVFYSMGNFVSHNANNSRSRSIVACIDIMRTTQAVELSCSYIPIFTSNNFGEKKYVVLPISNNSVDSRNIQRKDWIEKVVGKQATLNKAICFSELVENADKPARKKKKKQKPDLRNIESFPIKYEDESFVYSIYKDYVCIDGISPSGKVSSCSIPATVLDLPVTKLKEKAFSNNHTIQKINFRKNIQHVSDGLCKSCEQLEGFQLSDSMTEIKNEAFAGCTKLSAAVMRKGIQKIEKRAFYNCVSLRTVKIPPSVNRIAPDAFDGCEKATFYCEQGSYAEQYAKEHGFKVINMKLE